MRRTMRTLLLITDVLGMTVSPSHLTATAAESLDYYVDWKPGS